MKKFFQTFSVTFLSLLISVQTTLAQGAGGGGGGTGGGSGGSGGGGNTGGGVGGSDPVYENGIITNPVIGDLGASGDAASGSTFQTLFVHFWQVIIIIGAVTVLLMFLWGAIEWIAAGGDSGKIEKGRNRIINSIIGLFLLVFSFIIINFIGWLLFRGSFQILIFNVPTP
ncbi:MAG: hypothetical protein H6774_01960 [Pseudomonadales bacterium]|nr:hypothetical protein [Pseudomonadales bacterium]